MYALIELVTEHPHVPHPEEGGGGGACLAECLGSQRIFVSERNEDTRV
jgi:hypothetical protein